MTDKPTQEADFAFIAALAECAIAHGKIMLTAETAKSMLECAARLSTRSGDATELLRECKLMIRSLLREVEASDHLVRTEAVNGKTQWLRASSVVARIDAHLEGEA